VRGKQQEMAGALFGGLTSESMHVGSGLVDRRIAECTGRRDRRAQTGTHTKVMHRVNRLCVAIRDQQMQRVAADIDHRRALHHHTSSAPERRINDKLPGKYPVRNRLLSRAYGAPSQLCSGGGVRRGPPWEWPDAPKPWLWPKCDQPLPPACCGCCWGGGAGGASCPRDVSRTGAVKMRTPGSPSIGQFAGSDALLIGRETSNSRPQWSQR
jgi:hypothetical protein